MYVEIDKNNNVLGYSDKPSGNSIETNQQLPTYTDIQVLKFINDEFVVEDSDELRILKNAEPMKRLRQERNRRLTETDWMSFSDSPTMTDEWKTYRQALRDLPSTAEPQLDENGQLTNVTWPTKPE